MEKRAARAQSIDDVSSFSVCEASIACPDKSAAPKMTLAVTLLTAKGCAARAALYESQASAGDTLKDCVARGRKHPNKSKEKKKANRAMALNDKSSKCLIVFICCSAAALPTMNLFERWSVSRPFTMHELLRAGQAQKCDGDDE